MRFEFISKKDRVLQTGETITKITYKTEQYWIDITVCFGTVSVKVTSHTGVYSPGIVYDPVSGGCCLEMNGAVPLESCDRLLGNVKGAIETAEYLSGHLQELIKDANNS